MSDTPTTYPREFLQAMPKTDLHVHLDGSLRLETLLTLAKERAVALPADSAEGLRATVFKPQYADLNEYLRGFAYTTAVMTDEAALERVAYELAIDSAAEGVRYIEVRFAPQLHMHEALSFEQVMHAVDRGLSRAKACVNAGSPTEPPFEYGIVVCAMRFFTQQFSPYYRDFLRAHRFSSPQQVIPLASLELAKAAVALHRESDVQIVAFDLAGSEMGHPAGDHEEAFSFAHRHFLNKTVHAGEAYGPESIFQALTRLHADRIGHGLHLFRDDLIRRSDVADRRAYVRQLAKHIADHRITLEICLTSNLQTSPDIVDLTHHSFGTMLKENLSVTICTDNRLMSDTTVTDEYVKATQAFAIPPKKLRDIVSYGFKRSFFYGPYSQKRAYVRSAIARYDELARQFGVAH